MPFNILPLISDSFGISGDTLYLDMLIVSEIFNLFLSMVTRQTLRHSNLSMVYLPPSSSVSFFYPSNCNSQFSTVRFTPFASMGFAKFSDLQHGVMIFYAILIFNRP